MMELLTDFEEWTYGDYITLLLHEKTRVQP